MSLREEIDALFEDGQPDVAVIRCREIAAELDATTDLKVRADGFLAMTACTKRLVDAGRLDDALVVIAEIRARFSDEPAIRLRQRVVQVISQMETPIWSSLGQPEKALGSLDAAWSIVAASDQLIETGTGVELLLQKAAILHSLDRADEAVVVVDSAMRAISQATASSETGRAKKALMAVLYKLEDLVDADRGQEARTLGRQLADLLVEFATEQTRDGGDTDDPPRSDAELAKALAACTSAQAWSELERADQILSADVLIERAVRLYRVAVPWTIAVPTASTAATDAATEMLCAFADAYAMLTVPLTPEQRARVPLPRRTESEALLSAANAQDWAREQGHALQLPAPQSDPDQGDSTYTLEDFEEDYYNGRFVREILMLLYFYEFLIVLERFTAGREAARQRTLQRQSQYLLITKQALGRLAFVGETSGRTGAATVGLFIARAMFLIAHDHPDADPIPLPSTTDLREILHHTGAYDWLIEHGATLPPWTDPE